MLKFFKRFLIKGITINADIYVNKILPFAKREGRKIFGSRQWVFQQDGATSHTSNKSQKWCRNNFDAFMDKHHWPPNSPDLSPLDFFYWNEAQKNLNITPFMKIDSFKEAIKKACSLIDLSQIKKACQSFSSRERAVEESKGNYVEKRKINKN
jgi:hypothetical protein